MHKYFMIYDSFVILISRKVVVLMVRDQHTIYLRYIFVFTLDYVIIYLVVAIGNGPFILLLLLLTDFPSSLDPDIRMHPHTT